MTITLIAIGFVYLLSLGFISYDSIKKNNSIYLLILFFEYFAIFGLGIAPLLVGLGLIDLSTIDNYEEINGQISFWTFLHIFMFSLGSLFGYFISPKSKYIFATKLLKISERIKIGQAASYYGMILIGLSLLLIFIFIVGLDIAVGKAYEARSGFTELLGDGLQFAYIKRLVYAATLCIIFIPFLILRKSKSAILLPLLILTIGTYMVTVARAIFLETIVLTMLIYAMKQKNNLKPLIVFILGAPLLYFVLFYGKEFIAGYSAYLFNDSELVFVSSADLHGGIINGFFGNFVHLLVSIDSGVNHFLMYGPFFPKDVIVSVFSILPSSMFSALGIEQLNYNFIVGMDRMPCVNSAMIYGVEVDNCSIPPYVYGYSAYLAPLLGGFFFGALRFYLYSTFQQIWQQDAPGHSRTWLPFLLLLITINLMTFIPSVISLQIFVLIVFILLIAFIKIIQTVSNK